MEVIRVMKNKLFKKVFAVVMTLAIVFAYSGIAMANNLTGNVEDGATYEMYVGDTLTLSLNRDWSSANEKAIKWTMDPADNNYLAMSNNAGSSNTFTCTGSGNASVVVKSGNATITILIKGESAPDPENPGPTEPVKYPVEYKWADGYTFDLPEVPTDSATYAEDDAPVASTATFTDITVDTGKWSFDTWSAPVLGDTAWTFTGTWKFTSNPVVEPPNDPVDNTPGTDPNPGVSGGGTITDDTPAVEPEGTDDPVPTPPAEDEVTGDAPGSDALGAGSDVIDSDAMGDPDAIDDDEEDVDAEAKGVKTGDASDMIP